MALIACPECDKQISDKATTCPSCGCPMARVEETETVRATISFSEKLEGFQLSDQIVCPHCRKKGCILIRPAKAKKGISGAKTTGALFTMGLSMFATGLSRKEWVTEAKCKNCRAIWQF